MPGRRPSRASPPAAGFRPVRSTRINRRRAVGARRLRRVNMMTRSVGAPMSAPRLGRRPSAAAPPSRPVRITPMWKRPALLLGEGDIVAPRAPDRGCRSVPVPRLIRVASAAAGGHDVDLLVAPSGRFRRRSGCHRARNSARSRSTARWSAACAGPMQGQACRCRCCRPAPARKPRGCRPGENRGAKGHVARRDLLEWAAGNGGHVHQVDLWKAAFVAGVEDAVALGTEAGRQHERARVGQELHVRAIRNP